MELTDEDRRYYGTAVGFVGTFEEERAGLMNYLAENGVPVQIFGNDWGRWPNPHPLINIRNEAIYGDSYAKAICAAQIQFMFFTQDQSRSANHSLDRNSGVRRFYAGGAHRRTFGTV